MPLYTDQIGHSIQLNGTPNRIISLVPSQSEFLWDLGVNDSLVGVTKFCVHPTSLIKTKVIVGGTKQLNIDKIRALKPDLIIGNKEENDKHQIAILQKEFNVWMSDIYTLEDAYHMMREIGKMVNKQQEEDELSTQIKQDCLLIKNCFHSKRVAYFIWNNPYMLAGQNTFINDVLNHLGLVNVCSDLSRYPEVSESDLIQLNPDICLLSSEPFPFMVKHIHEIRSFLPNCTIKMVDGELFSWYGSRLRYLKEYVQKLSQIDLFHYLNTQ